MESLSEKLKSLGVRLGGRDLPPPPQRKPRNIEEVVPGYYHHNNLGDTWIMDTVYEKEYIHGNVKLYEIGVSETINEWAHTETINGIPISKIAFMDTETSGLAGGTGTFAFLVGLGSISESGFKVTQLFMKDPSEEPALLASLQRYFENFDVIVTFNGKSFDAPILKSRFTMHRMPNALDGRAHIDLLHLARRIWRNRLESRTLGDLEREILRFKRASYEIPGWMVPEIYNEYLQTGDPTPLQGVFYHNAVDIVSLAALMGQLSTMLDTSNLNDIPSLDLMAMAALFTDLGNYQHALKLYEHALEIGLEGDFLIRAMRNYSLIHKRQENWQEAVTCWEQLAEKGDAWACIELAKYYEHRQANLNLAHDWAQKAIKMGLQFETSVSEQLEHRLGRIQVKMEKQDL